MSYEDLVNNLSEQWRELAGKYSGNAGMIQDFFVEIAAAYNSPGKHYHNLHHIESLLNLSSEYHNHFVDKDVMDFAIFYHDIVYDVSRRDNEEQSAAIAGNRLSVMKLPAEKIQIIVQYIMASKTHAFERDENENDLAWFLDFDMSILGADRQTYLQYSQQVRQEFYIYSDIIYIDGRRRFLQQTLSMPFIFYTSELRTKYEQQARLNIQKELSMHNTH